MKAINSPGLIALALICCECADAQPYSFTTLAGTASAGSADGAGSAARFNSPLGVAVDGSGNVYVADANNHTIRKITPGGVVTTLAGSPGIAGSVNDTGSAARFNSPRDVAVDTSGSVFVADAGNHTIRRIAPNGLVTTLAGTPGIRGSADGTASVARFAVPTGVAVDGSGNVFVADAGNSTIRRITPGDVVTTVAGTAGSPGSADGAGSAARFDIPVSVAVDGVGNIFVADYDSSTIRKITPAGVVTTLAGMAGSNGSANGTGSAARFAQPRAVAVDGSGNVFVADRGNSTVRQITAAGVVTTLAGAARNPGSTDGTGSAARFSYFEGVAVDGSGNVFVADTFNQTIRKISGGGVVTTLAGTANGGSVDATGSAARFYDPQSVAVDSSGNVFVADAVNHTIRKITPGGVVTTLAGTAGSRGNANGTGSAARFAVPNGVAVDGSGNVFVADTGNYTIRKISSAGVVTTLAGTAGAFGNVDGTGSSARFTIASAIAVDSGGNVFVADSGANTIRKITPTGVVTTFAGTAGPSGSTDGTGTDARFGSPRGVAVDGSGNVFVADSNNHTIRKITATGVVTTLAGRPGSAGSVIGTGGAARFNGPQGVSVDGSGNVFVADTNNRTIRKITPDGVVTTVAGAPGGVGSAEGIGDVARFSFPQGIAVDPNGVVFVADSVGNNTIRRGVPTAVPQIQTQPASVATAANGTVVFSVVATASPAPAYQWLFKGTAILGATNSALNLTNVQSMDAGAYAVTVSNAVGSVTSAAAILTIIPLPAITTQPLALSVIAGNSATLGVVATSSAPLTFQWRKDGVNLAGATSSTYVIASAQLANAGSYTVAVTNSGGTISSAAAVLSVTRNYAGTYFGTFDGNLGNWALVVRSDGTGTYVAFLTNPKGGIVATVTIAADGTFRAASTLLQPESGVQSIGGRAVAAATGIPVTLSGAIGTTTVTGALEGTGVTFTGTLDPPVGETTAISGLYKATAAATTTYTAVGSSRQVLALTIGPTLVDGGVGTIASNGTFSITTADKTQINGTVTAVTGTITGNVTPDAGPSISVTGSATVGLGPPTVASAPGSRTAATGSMVVLAVVASGTTPLIYQWKKNGVDLRGASSATYAIAAAQLVDAGNYTCFISNSEGNVTTAAAGLTVIAPSANFPGARLVNLSIRTTLRTAGDTFTLGYVVGGEGTAGPKPFLIRAAGPSLGALGVSDTLDDPKLELFVGVNKTGENDNWGGSTELSAAFAGVGAFPYTAVTSRDAAIVNPVATPENSVRISAVGNGTGEVIAELYDAASSDVTAPRLVNVSVLKHLGTGLTAGFVIGGTGNKSILIRAIGPTLATVFNLEGAVADPQLTLFSGPSAISSNDNWGGSVELTSAFTTVAAFPLAATSRDSALLATLPPGAYTVQVSGVAGGTGDALIEIYEVP